MSTAKFYRLNYQIRAAELRVIDSDGTQLGVLSLQEALNKAKDQGLDLVEIAANAMPPVARIIDFKKFKYEENKKQRLNRKNSHESETKEIWLGPLMSDHDLDIRLRRAKEFLSINDRVKFTVKFSGREMNHPEFGFKVLEKVNIKLAGLASQDGTPRFFGRNLSVAFLPIKGKATEKQTNESTDQKSS